MGLLFTKIWSLFGNEEHKIVMVGLDNAGKTTILYQYLMNEVVHTSPTIGSNVEEVVWKNIHFIMWDLGGQQSLRAAWSTYYSNTERPAGRHQGGAVPHAGPRGAVEGGRAHLRQQAGPEGLHERRRDQQAAGPHLHQGPPLADPVVLRPHRRGPVM
ncbi:ADP-ribosylation factor-like protein 5B isoform X6 [Bacillus rossius redtenbacheri]|uniref:ADP-ribosylation factor-like protein 5B isoform X5 n=1 Tax=Bacillus rossius redtenbacheri TaxID=93214 RepID=UPI002FDCC330